MNHDASHVLFGEVRFLADHLAIADIEQRFVRLEDIPELAHQLGFLTHVGAILIEDIRHDLTSVAIDVLSDVELIEILAVVLAVAIGDDDRGVSGVLLAVELAGP